LVGAAWEEEEEEEEEEDDDDNEEDDDDDEEEDSEDADEEEDADFVAVKKPKAASKPRVNGKRAPKRAAAPAEEEDDGEPPMPGQKELEEIASARLKQIRFPDAQLKMEMFVNFVIKIACEQTGLAITRDHWHGLADVAAGGSANADADEMTVQLVSEPLNGSVTQKSMLFKPARVHKLADALLRFARYACVASVAYARADEADPADAAEMTALGETLHKEFVESVMEVQNLTNDF